MTIKVMKIVNDVDKRNKTVDVKKQSKNTKPNNFDSIFKAEVTKLK